MVKISPQERILREMKARVVEVDLMIRRTYSNPDVRASYFLRTEIFREQCDKLIELAGNEYRRTIGILRSAMLVEDNPPHPNAAHHSAGGARRRYEETVKIALAEYVRAVYYVAGMFTEEHDIAPAALANELRKIREEQKES